MKTTIEAQKAEFTKQRDALAYEIFVWEAQLTKLRANLHATDGAIQACDLFLKSASLTDATV